MAQTAANVRIDKPLAAGAVWIAPKGTALPTDQSGALNVAFVCVGYLLKGGITQSNARNSTPIIAYGGDTVAVASSDDTATVKFVMIETNDTSLGLYRGKANVSTAGGTRTIQYNAQDLDHNAMVIDLQSTSGFKRRLVSSDAQVTDRGDIVYEDEAATAFDVTLTCYPDSNGNKVTEYQGVTAPAVPFLSSIVDNDGSPTTFAAAGGGLGYVRGSGLTGTTAVTMGGTAVTSFRVLNDGELVVIAPAHAAGSGLPLVVTNATGVSTTGTTLVTYV